MAQPLVPWIGGKTRLAKHLLPLFGRHTCYCEPFAGAAGLFFKKSPSEVEVLNDINGDLINLYRVVQHHLDEFVRHFRWSMNSRKYFEWENKKVPDTLTDIQRAARFFYLQKLSFGGKVQGRAFGYATTAPPRLNLLRIEEDLSQAHMRLAGCFIENLPWDDVVKRYDAEHSLFYCDPPYWETEGYGVDFGLEQYDLMAELARSIKGRMIISVNDHPEMRRVFDGLEMSAVPIKYSLGNNQGKAAQSAELIIRSPNDVKGGVLPLI